MDFLCTKNFQILLNADADPDPGYGLKNTGSDSGSAWSNNILENHYIFILLKCVSFRDNFKQVDVKVK